ncbi:MAG: amidohydrolase family protein, partial [Myxococcales bacterium]|nr:amidohydrolase family protein [Myxococcales bacterium]
MAGYRARALLTEAGVLEDGVLGVEDGRITELRAGGPYDVDLGDVAVLPGLVNAHSHAFQRVLRGRAEHLLAARPEADFWTWRARMYQAALALGPDEIEAVSAMAFLEMALSGITTVGEFHYLHHDPKGAVYADPNELAHRVIAAARGVGLRIALLRVAYHRAGFDRPAEPEQRRFVEPDVYTFLGRAEALAASYKNDQMVTIGLAPHSV